MEYRIYDTRDKCYLEESDGKWMLTRSGLIYSVERDKYYNNGERYLIERFTGLKDKNGEEIYEGDYVKTLHYKFDNDKDEPTTYNREGYLFYGKKYQLGLYLQWRDGRMPISNRFQISTMNGEVTGNIHETENK